MRRTTLLAAVVLAALTAVSGCSDGDGKSSGKSGGKKATSSAGAEQSASHTIVLEAAGGAGADIAYAAGSEAAQETEVKLPWKKSLTVEKVPDTVSVMVVPAVASEVSCKITIDGKVANETKVDASQTAASCRVG